MKIFLIPVTSISLLILTGLPVQAAGEGWVSLALSTGYADIDRYGDRDLGTASLRLGVRLADYARAAATVSGFAGGGDPFVAGDAGAEFLIDVAPVVPWAGFAVGGGSFPFVPEGADRVYWALRIGLDWPAAAWFKAGLATDMLFTVRRFGKRPFLRSITARAEVIF